METNFQGKKAGRVGQMESVPSIAIQGKAIYDSIRAEPEIGLFFEMCEGDPNFGFDMLPNLRIDYLI